VSHAKVLSVPCGMKHTLSNSQSARIP
jgi:hypothetical protein